MSILNSPFLFKARLLGAYKGLKHDLEYGMVAMPMRLLGAYKGLKPDAHSKKHDQGEGLLGAYKGLKPTHFIQIPPSFGKVY